jgi:hypothetical protein
MKMDAIDELVARSPDCREVRGFHEFHRKHPEVLDFLVEEIRSRFNRGFTSFSYRTLWEYTRWKLEMEKGPGDSFLMNDHCAPLYACAIAILHPEFDGLAAFSKDKTDAVLRTQIGATAQETTKELWVSGQWYSLASWMAAHEAALVGKSPCNRTAERNAPSLSLLRA